MLACVCSRVSELPSCLVSSGYFSAVSPCGRRLGDPVTGRGGVRDPWPKGPSWILPDHTTQLLGRLPPERQFWSEISFLRGPAPKGAGPPLKTPYGTPLYGVSPTIAIGGIIFVSGYGGRSVCLAPILLGAYGRVALALPHKFACATHPLHASSTPEERPAFLCLCVHSGGSW